MLEEGELRAAAAAAFRNAQAILEDVDVLYQAGRWPRSVSLAIIGREEMGKAVIYSVAALNRLPGLRTALSGKRREDPVRDHEFKQLAAEIANIAHFMAEDAVYNSDGMAGPTNDAEWVDAVLGDSAAWLRDTGVIGGVKARRAHVARDKAWRRSLTEGLPAAFQHHEADELETKKWRGLYVDLGAGGLHEPTEIGEYEARSARADLEIDISALFRLGAFLQDDEMWGQLDRTPVDEKG